MSHKTKGDLKRKKYFKNNSEFFLDIFQKDKEYQLPTHQTSSGDGIKCGEAKEPIDKFVYSLQDLDCRMAMLILIKLYRKVKLIDK